MSEWIEWDGGKCPVNGDVLVDVRFGDDIVCKDGTAKKWNWMHAHSHSLNIVAYRLSSPPQPRMMPEEAFEDADKPKSTGTKHDSGKAPLGLISSIALIAEAGVLAFGARKYAAHNWRGGMDWSRVYDAIQRHLVAWNAGEDVDPETGLSHLAHARCGLGFLLDYAVNHKELDDRYKGNP